MPADVRVGQFPPLFFPPNSVGSTPTGRTNSQKLLLCSKYPPQPSANARESAQRCQRSAQQLPHCDSSYQTRPGPRAFGRWEQTQERGGEVPHLREKNGVAQSLTTPPLCRASVAYCRVVVLLHARSGLACGGVPFAGGCGWFFGGELTW